MIGGAGQFGPPDGQAVSLVGREREQRLLRERLAAALVGRGGLVLVGGEAGIGKTALARALAREAAERGALALTGHSYDLAETPPYGPWIEILEQVPAMPDRPPLPALAGPGGVAEGVASQAALFAQVRDFFAALAAQQPLVLVLDDLHWADPASLELLRFLARQLAARPLLLVATYRADELTRRHPLFQLLPVLVRETEAARLDLRRLELDDVRVLVAARYRLLSADEARLVVYLQGHAEGNPFYLGELLRTLEEERLLRPEEPEGWALGDLARARVPTLLRQVIEGRTARLGEEARELLAIGAVIGQEVPLDLWAAVSGAREEALLAAAERAVEAHVLEEASDGAGLRFAHALIREALYEGTLPLRRRGWHRRAGEALLAAAPAPDPDTVAYHLRVAGDPRAAEWLVKAGERAQAAYAWLTAAERYEAALALLAGDASAAGERARLLASLAQLRRYSAPRQGVAYLEEARRLAETAGDHVLARASLFDQGHLRCLAGEAQRGLEQMRAALPALEALAPAERARLPAYQVQRVGAAELYHRGALVIQLANFGRLAEALAAGEPMVARGPGTTARGLHGLGLVYAQLGQPALAARAYADARAAYRAAEQYAEVYLTLRYELWTLALPYYADQPAQWRHLLDEGDEVDARATGALPHHNPRGVALPILVLQGAWDEAHQLARAPANRALRPVRGARGRLARARGDAAAAWAEVWQELPAGPATEPGDSFLDLGLELQRLAADLALEAADLATARAWLACQDRWLAWSGAVLGRAEAALGWAAYHRAAGDRGQAREHVERALADASEPRQPLALLAAHRFLGELDTAAGRHAAAQAHLDQALALAEACAAPYERALTLLALAELRLTTGDRDAAQAVLDESRAILTGLEAKPALARAEALAGRLAPAPPAQPAAPTYPAGLSAREVEVLRLVAEGLPDAQIAARLYLSPYTVKAHLRSIYGKLGVASRTAASRFAIERGLS